MTTTSDKTTVPAWCVAVDKMPEGVSGAKGCEEFEGYELAGEIYGEAADDRNSGLAAFAYLWRRFGPPTRGCDDHKGLVSYYIGTPNPGVFLWLGLSGSSLRYAVGFLATREVREPIYALHRTWMSKAAEWARGQGLASVYDIWLGGDKKQERASRLVAEIGECPRPDASKWRDPAEPCHTLNQAVADALEELLRPVYIRDIPINIFGRMKDVDACEWESAERSKYAGYGVPIEAMDELIKSES